MVLAPGQQWGGAASAAIRFKCKPCNKVYLPVKKYITIIIIITRPWPAYGRHGLAGLLGGDQSGRINSSHSIIEELARSDWMGLSGGDQSGRINTSHSIIEELARFGHFGSFFAILGHFWPFLGHFGSFLAIFGHIGSFLGHFGSCGVILNKNYSFLYFYRTCNFPTCQMNSEIQ